MRTRRRSRARHRQAAHGVGPGALCGGGASGGADLQIFVLRRCQADELRLPGRLHQVPVRLEGQQLRGQRSRRQQLRVTGSCSNIIEQGGCHHA